MIDTEGTASLRCAGTIENGVYVLHVGKERYRLQTLSTGVDDWGPFAVLEPHQVSLGAGRELTVEAEPEELEPGAPLGCRVALIKRRDPAIMEQLLRGRGIDPQSVNVLDPPETAVAVHFHPSGQCTCWMRTYRAQSTGTVRH
jgi:hypothetical protein